MENILNRLRDNTQTLSEAVQKQPGELLNKKPDAETWSVTEVLEHLFIVDKGVMNVIKEAGLQEEGFEENTSPEVLEKTLLNRNTKAEAPKQVVPKGRFESAKEALEAFRKQRTQLSESLERYPALMKKQGMEHPFFGKLSVGGWVNFSVLHAERHLEQIRETLEAVKA